jgi:hypothetical protein
MLEDAPGGDASASGSRQPRDAAPAGTIPAPGSSDIVDSGAIELGLMCYPRVPPPHSSWMQVEGGMELTCLWVAAVGRLLQETLATVSQDILQPAQARSTTEKRFLLRSIWSFLGSQSSSFL